MIGQITTQLAAENLNITELLNHHRGALGYTIIDVEGKLDPEVLGRIRMIDGVQMARAIERRARVSVETWSPIEKLSIEAKEVDPVLLQTRAAQLSVALGLSLRKEKEARA